MLYLIKKALSYTRESLESIYRNSELPFKLIYVDGNSPRSVKEYLETQAQQKEFELIRADYYLYPNQARNLGLAKADTKYVVFADNDIGEISIDGGKVRLRTTPGQPGEWKGYKAVNLYLSAKEAFFQDNDRLVDWVNQQPSSNPLICLGDGHRGI